MKHDGEIDYILSDLTRTAMQPVAVLAQSADFDAALMPADAPEEQARCLLKGNFRRTMLAERPASAHYALTSENPYTLALQFHSFAGFCADAAMRVGLEAQARDIAHTTIDVEEHLGVHNTYGHFSSLVKIERDGESGIFLIDPTYRQFAVDVTGRDDWMRRDGFPLPAEFLRQSDPQMHDQILGKGYVQFTPARADIYMRSFQQGTREQAFPGAYDALTEDL